MMTRMTGFVFQDEYLDRVQGLTDEQLGRLVRALSAYHVTGEAPKLEGMERIAFDFIRPEVDRIEAHYRATCETNRRNRAGARKKTAADETERPLTDADDAPRAATEPDQDKDQVQAKEKDQPEPDRDDHHQDGDALERKVRQAFSGLTDTHLQALGRYRALLGDGLVSYAADRAVANGARGWGYLEQVLKGYEAQGIRTVEAARAADDQFRRQRTRSRPEKTVRAQQYAQREYREADAEAVYGVTELFR